MKRYYQVALLVGLLACIIVIKASWVVEATGVDLAQIQGWDIVVAQDAIATDTYAAEEFQTLFELVSGVKLPITHEARLPNYHIFIGTSSAMLESNVGFTVENMGSEDLRIVVRDRNIAIAGGPPRGTLFGVYTFMEDYFGIRFLTEAHTHAPPLESEHIVGPLDRIYRPAFAHYRGVGYADRSNGVFAIRSRANNLYNDKQFGIGTPFCSSFINIGHSFYRQIPLDQYGETHPEYYAMWNGARDNKHVHTHYCLSNPDLVPIVTDAVIGAIEHPSSVARKNFAVSQNDTIWEFCQCDNCMAIDTEENSHMGTLLRFVNSVAGNIGETYPDVYVGALAYGFSRRPPENTVCLPNVQINLSNIEACQLHATTDLFCPTNVAFYDDLKGWSENCSHLYGWMYGVNFRDMLLPFPNLDVLSSNVKTLADAGTEGLYVQCASFKGEMSSLRHYLLSRLTWNPTLDGNALIEEFNQLHYGKAAPAIRDYIEYTQEHYDKLYIHNASNIAAMWDLPVDPEVAAKSIKIFARGLLLAENDIVHDRVERASICAWRAAINPVWRLQPDDEIDPALAESMRPLLREFFRLCDKHGLRSRDIEEPRDRLEGILHFSESKVNQ